MPAYDFKCDICERVVELQRSMAEHDKPEPCKAKIETSQTYSNTKVGIPNVDETIPASNVTITSSHTCLGILYRVGIDLTARMSYAWKF